MPVDYGIYCYWEGENRHWLYDLCWETVRHHNPGAVLLGRKDIETVLGPLPPELDQVYVVHRVDWIRKMWIYRVGGLWVDMDFCCWAPLQSIAGLAADFDYVGYQEWHGTGWMDNFFAARRESPVLLDAANYALERIRESNGNVPWLATNAQAMNHAMGLHQWKKWIQIPTHLISPISVMEKAWFTTEDDFDVSGFCAFGQILSFHGLGDWVKGRFAKPEELLESKFRLAKVLRRGLGMD